MATSNFNLRNIAPDMSLLLKREAIKRNISVNSLILQIIEQGLGIAHPAKKTVFHDLDYLAGTWSHEDKKVFDDNIKFFKNIDKELWS
jgi:hypothetical protein